MHISQFKNDLHYYPFLQTQSCKITPWQWKTEVVWKGVLDKTPSDVLWSISKSLTIVPDTPNNLNDITECKNCVALWTIWTGGTIGRRKNKEWYLVWIVKPFQILYSKDCERRFACRWVGRTQETVRVLWRQCVAFTFSFGQSFKWVIFREFKETDTGGGPSGALVTARDPCDLSTRSREQPGGFSRGSLWTLTVVSKACRHLLKELSGWAWSPSLPPYSISAIKEVSLCSLRVTNFLSLIWETQ